MPRTILLVSYYFPPDSAVGGLRAAKFVRSLPEFGWEPSVLTVEDHYRDQGFDHGRLKGLEGVQIARTGALPSLSRLYLGLKSRLRKGASTASSVAVPVKRTGPETIVRRVKRYVVSLLIMLPDDQKNWSIYAAFAAVRRIREQKIDCVLTSGPPHSIHIVGLLARLFTRAKWIADFRDPWAEMLSEREPETRSPASDAVERWMEGLVMTYADKVLTTTNRLRLSLIDRYPGVAAGKFVCLPNSIDTHSIELVTGCVKYDPLTITYAGTLYFDRTPEPLFQAVGELIQAGLIAECDIRIKLVGHCRMIDNVDTVDVVRRYGLESRRRGHGSGALCGGDSHHAPVASASGHCPATARARRRGEGLRLPGIGIENSGARGGRCDARSDGGDQQRQCVSLPPMSPASATTWAS